MLVFRLTLTFLISTGQYYLGINIQEPSQLRKHPRNTAFPSCNGGYYLEFLLITKIKQMYLQKDNPEEQNEYERGINSPMGDMILDHYFQGTYFCIINSSFY